jgi:hypothetical protein
MEQLSNKNKSISSHLLFFRRRTGSLTLFETFLCRIYRGVVVYTRTKRHERVRNGKGPIPQDFLLIFCEARNKILKKCTDRVTVVRPRPATVGVRRYKQNTDGIVGVLLLNYSLVLLLFLFFLYI